MGRLRNGEFESNGKTGVKRVTRHKPLHSAPDFDFLACYSEQNRPELFSSSGAPARLGRASVHPQGTHSKTVPGSNEALNLALMMPPNRTGLRLERRCNGERG
jgi:hypothetical protein